VTRPGPRVAHEALPRTTTTRRPRRALLTGGRPLAQAILRRRFNLEIHGAEHFPEHGPVVVAANHIGFLDGPLMAIMSPRPVHALTKREMFKGAMGPFLSATGQIPVWRNAPDPAAIRTTLRVLRDGGAVGVFPEGTRGAGELASIEGGAAYFAMVTGATVVPLAMLGTRDPGGSLNSVPKAGTRMVMTFGAPVSFDWHAWPRRTADVRAAAQDIRTAILQTLRDAEATTGISLPGPVPPTLEKESL
jgi:1-acyl-sn-glycerol-3-phosphate acyltransferase